MDVCNKDLWQNHKMLNGIFKKNVVNLIPY